MNHAPFDPSKFTAPKAKPLPVILLLDVSGSMSGSKISELNASVQDMLNEFSNTESSEVEIHVSIITFGTQVKLHQSLTNASAIEWQNLVADGLTPLGTALKMAKAMIEDKDVIPSRAYRPTVILVSDGGPTDQWEQPLHEFIVHGRSSKCDRMAVAIGAGADESVLGKFIEGTTHRLFYAKDSKQLRDFFKFVTMSVTIRTKSQTPNIIPESSTIDIQPATIDMRQDTTKSVAQKSTDSEDSYW